MRSPRTASEGQATGLLYGDVILNCLGSPSPAWVGARGGGDEGGKSTGLRLKQIGAG